MADNYDYGFGYDWGYDTPYLDQEADLPLAYDPSGNPTWDFQFTDLAKLLKTLGGDVSSGSALKAIGSILGGGGAGSFLASAGIKTLLDRLSGGNKPAPVGYQGGIPQYTVERAQTPIAQQRPVTYESLSAKPGEMAAAVMVPRPYRPGQGGITYFTPTKYTPTGKDLGAPTAPATGGTTGGTTGGSNVGVDTGGSVATPGYTGPVTVDGQPIEYASGGAMSGGIAMLAKGRYIQGDGDGVSDSVPAQFVRSKRPAALSDGEFVFPARIVAEIGNGSNKAGAKKLYAFMDRVEARAKSAKRGKPSGADKELSRLA